MVHPLVPRLVQHRDPAYRNLPRVVAQGRLSADGAEERVPAVGDGRGVQEREVEGLEGPRGSAGQHAVDDGGVLGGGDGFGVFVWETHFASG